MPEHEPLLRAYQRAGELSVSLADEIEDLDLRTHAELSSFMGAAVIAGARAVQAIPVPDPHRNRWTLRYCACLHRCDTELVQSHGLNRDVLNDLFAKAGARAWERRDDPQLLLRVSMADLGRMIGVWGTGLRSEDEAGYTALATSLTAAMATGLVALATRPVA